jgi:hypothetical protein
MSHRAKVLNKTTHTPRNYENEPTIIRKPSKQRIKNEKIEKNNVAKTMTRRMNLGKNSVSPVSPVVLLLVATKAREETTEVVLYMQTTRWCITKTLQN